MTIKIEINSEDNSRLKDVVNKRRDAGMGETLEDAYTRLMAMKNSGPDEQRIKDVILALQNGLIGRETMTKKLTKAEVKRLHLRLKEVERERLLQEMVDSLTDNYVLVQTPASLEDAVKTLSAEPIIVFDVESTGVDVWNDYIVGHVLSAPSVDKHYYIPTKHDTDEFQLDHDYVNSVLTPLYEDESIGKIAANARFDIHMLDREGITLTNLVWDTQEAQKLLNENEDSFALKRLVTKYLGIESYTYGDLFGNIGFHEVSDLTTALAYAAKDGYVTWELYKFQRKHMSKMPEMLRYFETVEVPIIDLTFRMEKKGFDIDLEFAEEYGKRLDKQLEERYKAITAVLGDINLNSPPQLKEALEAHTGRTLASTDAKKVLKPLAKEFPVVAELLEYKADMKLNSTYVKAIPKLINQKTGKLHAQLNPNGTKTGRYSSGGSGTNLLNQSPEARKMYIPPKGKVWVGADFKAQEIRCVASLSKEQVLIDAFEHNRDPYAMMAANFYDRPYEEVYKKADGSDTKERKQFKVVWLATLYGMGPQTLADMLQVNKQEAVDLQDQIFESMPKLKAWIDGSQEHAIKYGFVWLHNKQRKRRLPEAQWSTAKIPYGKYFDPKYEEQRKKNGSISRALRQGPNAEVQGSSGIQMKNTMLAADKLCQSREGWAVVLSIYDELVWEVPEDFTEQDAQDIADVMVNTYKFDGVDNGTDLEVFKRWGDGISLEEWFSENIG